ncbi:MAG: hypothetical protein ABJA67_01895 [Chthonomonadales bacterium]
MFGSTVLEIAVGLIFIYLVLSLVCTSVNEYIAQMIGLRAENLYKAIHGLFDGPDAARIAEDIYHHSMVLKLGQKTDKIRKTEDGDVNVRKKPSYIPAATFSAAITDLIGLVEPAGATETLEAGHFEKALTPAEGRYDKQILNALRPLIDSANGNLDTARKNIEKWYDDAMERASGWYKRKIQILSFCVAMSVAIITNADSLMMLDRLWASPAQRTQIEAAAKNLSKDPLPADAKTLDKATKDAATGLLGWKPANTPNEPRSLPVDVGGWGMKVLGLIITAFAASLGAPFWFDMLSKVMKISSSGSSPHDPATKTGSQTIGEKNRVASSDANHPTA